MTMTVATSSVEDTRRVAAAVAALAASGDVILLAGDLGAGKTAFAQGFGAALGVEEPIVSPTFTLARQYQGRLRLHHLDVYRLDRIDEIFDVGLPELIEDDGVVLIEWGDVVRAELPPDLLQIDITLGDGDDDRTLALTTVGARWADRAPSLSAALEAWRC